MNRREFLECGLAAGVLPLVISRKQPKQFVPVEQHAVRARMRNIYYDKWHKLSCKEPYLSFVSEILDVFKLDETDPICLLYLNSIIFGDGFLYEGEGKDATQLHINVLLGNIGPENVYRIESTNGDLIEYQLAHNGADYRLVDSKLDRTTFVPNFGYRILPKEILHLAPDRDIDSYPYGNSLLPLADVENGVEVAAYCLLSAQRDAELEQEIGIGLGVDLTGPMSKQFIPRIRK